MFLYNERMQSSKEKQPRNDHGRTEAFYASQRDDTGELLAICLDEGVDQDAVDDRGDTVLHWASWNNRFNAMSVLLMRGANPNIQNHRGHAPLHHVINRNKVGSPFLHIKSLLAAGADPSLADERGNTPYHAFAMRSCGMLAQDALSIAQLLSDKGGTDEWFRPNDQGQCALDIAAEAKDPNLAIFVTALQASILETKTPPLAPSGSSGPTRRL